MADKTTTLTTQTGDSIYPNVLDENIPDTIARVSDINKLKTDVETAYLTKNNAEATYQTKAGRVDYVSKTYGDGTYATITQLGGKQDKLTAGTHITIEGTTISATRPENIALYGDLAATDGEFTGGTGSGGGSGATGGGSNNTLYPYNVHWNLYNESFELLIFKKEKLVNRTIKTVDELKELLDYPNNTHLLVHGTVKPSSTSSYNTLVSDFIVKNSPSFSLIVYYRTWTGSGATDSFVLPVDASSLAGITIYPLLNDN